MVGYSLLVQTVLTVQLLLLTVSVIGTNGFCGYSEYEWLSTHYQCSRYSRFLMLVFRFSVVGYSDLV